MAPPPEGPVAAIDCGTNSTRLLVVDASGASLVRLMRITRLGQGVDATGMLDPEAVERTLSVLSDFRGVMDELAVRGARMVATSAVRDAANGPAFLAAATDATGVTAELLSGEEEGALAYAGATDDLSPSAGDDVVIDIGGGSTELVLQRDGRIHAVSMDLGCVRLTERAFHGDPPTAADIADAVATVDAELDAAVGKVPILADLRPGSRLIGLAGTVSTLAMLEQGLAHYDRDQIHHYRLDRSVVDRWCAILAAEPAARRLERPGIVAGREDVILGGAVVLRQAMARLGFDECLVSESDILDGLASSQRA